VLAPETGLVAPLNELLDLLEEARAVGLVLVRDELTRRSLLLRARL
jgi:hypothetical protein